MKYQLFNSGWSKYNVHDIFNIFLTKWLPKCAVSELLLYICMFLNNLLKHSFMLAKISIYLMSIYIWLLVTLFFSLFTHPSLSLFNLLENNKHQHVLYPTFQIQWFQIPWECQSLHIRLENFSTPTLNHWPWFRAVQFHPPTLLFLSYCERKSQCTWIISLTSVVLLNLITWHVNANKFLLSSALPVTHMYCTTTTTIDILRLLYNDLIIIQLSLQYWQ